MGVDHGGLPERTAAARARAATRSSICEDTDGDGVCDKVTTFADKLSIATSLLPYAGGVIVHQAPVTLFLKDTDGDGKADVRQELFRGWSTGDTHAGPSNLHYGFDNWIYGSVGYAGFRGAVGGERLNFRQGFYRFKVERNRERDAFGDLKVTQARIPPQHEQQHLGAVLQRERANCSAAPRTAARSSTCRSRTGTTRRCAA